MTLQTQYIQSDRDGLCGTVHQAGSHWSSSWSHLHAEPLAKDKRLLPTKAIRLGKPCCAHPALDGPCSGGSAGQFTNSLGHEVGRMGS